MIDFHATERVDPPDRYLNNYIAVFDPSSGELQITEAKRLAVRSSVRQPVKAQTGDSDTEVMPATNYSARAALTHAFGTKKAKKAVQSIAENALMAGGAEESNPLSSAILSSMPVREAREGLSDQIALAQANKPLPIPDLTTDDITKVYPFSSLVFPSPASRTLAELPTETWENDVNNNVEILSFSRFVASRVSQMALMVKSQADSESARSHLKILRYIECLVQLIFLFGQAKTGRKRLPTAVVAEKTGTPIPRELLDKIISHFCPRGLSPNRAEMTLLQTTVLALTLHLPPPSGNHGANILVTFPYDIRQDLRLDDNQLGSLYRELGCKWEGATDSELQIWGYENQRLYKKTAKELGRKPRFAKLKFPLVFPRRSQGRPR